MRRITICIAAALAFANAVFAADWNIRDVDIRVRLYNDGSAVISEKWELTANEGTEMYLPRENMGDMEISEFSVTDETGAQYAYEGRWDVNRSLSQKAGRCGINKTGRGYELCWGIGSYGSHTFNIRYVMSNVVKSLNDYDMLHVQFVNDEMVASPAHVKVTVEALPKQIDTSWVRMWGFGYIGTTSFEDGKAVFESTEHFRYESSIIALMRFDKGVFSPLSVLKKDFKDEQDKAFRGSEYVQGDSRTWWQRLWDTLYPILIFVVFLLFPFLFARGSGVLTARQKRKILGSKPEKVAWYRDLPFNGDIYKTDYVLDRFDTKRQQNTIASAIILRLLQKGYLAANKDEKGKVEIYFSDFADTSKLDSHELGLYNMMKEASGSDSILQDKEFSRWSGKSSNKGTIRSWAEGIESDAKIALRKDNVYVSRKFTESGRTEAQHVFGFRNFLRDFTLVEDRESVEVGLWQDYLVYASLYGIADQVAKELKDINPQVFDEVVMYDYGTFNDVIRMSNNLANSITNARNVPSQAANFPGSGSIGGFGGGASFGGGGGFSGGGHGGGIR
ncbi:MAG: DUF2207 domain-containing protein [Bacteroidia bacterium]|nr:DUF2207 domain-containing protein [Bacteroidia bacterium]